MTNFDEPEDGLTARLRALGQFPVDPATQSRHLSAMAEAAAAPTLFGTLGNRIRVAVALVVGFMLGTTGLASAGALGPLQPIASTTLGKVGIEVPEGGKGTARSTEGCPQGATYKNRGQYLKAMREQHGADTPAFEEAKKARCGMPVVSKGAPGVDDEAEASEGDDDGTGRPEGKGKPENPGKSGEKGRSAEKSQQPDDASQKPAEGDVPGADSAECAGSVAAPSTTPPDSAPKQPDCAADEKAANAPEGDASATASSAGDDVAEDKTQDTPAAEQVPSEADTSSEGS